MKKPKRVSKELWIARDGDEAVFLYEERPVKMKIHGDFLWAARGWSLIVHEYIAMMLGGALKTRARKIKVSWVEVETYGAASSRLF